MNRDPVAARIYDALLRLYPRDFRDEFGLDMSLLFRDQWADEPAVRVTARAVLDLALTLPQQHLEVHVRRNSTKVVSVVYLSLAAAGLVTALIGGTNRVTLRLGALVAVGAGALGTAAHRRAATVSTDPVSAGWWKPLIAGPLLIGAVIVAAGLGVQAWYAGMIATLLGLILCTAGVVLGVVHLLTGRQQLRNG